MPWQGGVFAADQVIDTNGSGQPVPFYRWRKDGVQFAQTTTPSTPGPVIPDDGTYLFTVRVVDAAGNESADGPAFSLVLDAQAPPTPGIPRLVIGYSFVTP